MKSKKKFGIEELSKGAAREIKEFEESTDPLLLRANKLFAEVGKERLEAQLNARLQNKPVIEGPSCRRIFRSMGFVNAELGRVSYYAGESFDECTRIAKGMGFSADRFCDKSVVELAAFGTEAWTKPDLILGDGHACDIDHHCCARTLADMFNIPFFLVDFPLCQDDKPTLASISYIADQYGEFIEWAEKKVPGVKYDEARHIEMLEMDAIAQKYQAEVYQLLKHVPSPISPEEAHQVGYLGFQPSKYPNMQKALEYLRMMRDELGERVASGKGPYPEERLRLLWAGNYEAGGDLARSKLLLERKVGMPVVAGGYRKPAFSSFKGAVIGDVSRYGVKLSPLQEEAADLILDWLGGPGKRWVNRILDLARDIGAHGIIHFQLIGCTPMNSMGTMVAERAEKELGIPTLNFIGRQMDKDFMSLSQFEETLSPFVDKCFEWAGKPRQ